MTEPTIARQGSDAAELARRYSRELEDGLERLRARRERGQHIADAMAAVTGRAARGVLRYSEREDELAAARAAVHELALDRARRRVAGVVEALRRAGAAIAAEATNRATIELAQADAERELAEVDQWRGGEVKPGGVL